MALTLCCIEHKRYHTFFTVTYRSPYGISCHIAASYMKYYTNIVKEGNGIFPKIVSEFRDGSFQDSLKWNRSEK